MNLSQTLKLLRDKERKSGSRLQSALELKRYREQSKFEIIEKSHAFYLPAVSTHARIKWGCVFIRQIYKFFNLADDQHGPNAPVFHVTVADKSGLTTDQLQTINLRCIKRKLASALKGLSYIGMVEPGYFNNAYSEPGDKVKNVVSWHGHFLVWGVTKKQLAEHLEGIKPRFIPICLRSRPVNKKIIKPEWFGHVLWYLIKSPCKEYSIGKRSEPEAKTGAARYKQNLRKIRPGHRVKLFHLMRGMYLDKLAMAGGEGRKLLQKMKYDALCDYRRHNGWHDYRP